FERLEILAGGLVVKGAIVALISAGKSQRQLFVLDGDIDSPLVQLGAEVAKAALEVSAKFATGLGGGQVERTAGSVAAKQCALGASQHFGLRQIEDGEVTRRHARIVDAVNVNSHCGVNGRVSLGLRLPANGHVN